MQRNYLGRKLRTRTDSSWRTFGLSGLAGGAGILEESLQHDLESHEKAATLLEHP